MSVILDLCKSQNAVTFEAGDSLIAEGTLTGILLILIAGEVEIVKQDVQIDTVSQPGAIFGEVSTLLHIPHMATVRAIAPTRAYRIENGAAFLTANPALAIEISRLLAQRLDSVTKYLVNLKHQFEDHSNHLGMVDEVLETLLHQQKRTFIPGSVRDPDPTL